MKYIVLMIDYCREQLPNIFGWFNLSISLHALHVAMDSAGFSYFSSNVEKEELTKKEVNITSFFASSTLPKQYAKLRIHG